MEMDLKNILSGNSLMPLRISLTALSNSEPWFCEACDQEQEVGYGGRVRSRLSTWPNILESKVM